MKKRWVDLLAPYKATVEKIGTRIDYLSNVCDYDLLKLINAILLIFMASALFQPGDYLKSSETLSQLGVYASEMQWAGLLLFVGIAELILLIVTGTPPLFARNTRDVLFWHRMGAVGFWACILLFGTLAFLLSPHTGGFGWGTSFCGAFTAHNLYACKRAGRSIAVDKMVVKIKRLPALSRLDSTTIDAIVMELR